ncbi:MAG: SAM-dependent chlorinase/fluorinase [Actinomycetota bacterium]
MSTYPGPFISFLSDYGLADEFVGVCHGVILALAPHSRIIDLTHGVGPGDVGHASLLLARAVSYLPSGVHLAVVDPGVGTQRRAVVIESAQGSMLVGPDNGLLLPASARLGGVSACHCLENPDLMLARPSRTFHGRDVFAPAAAHLALGTPPAAFGRAVSPSQLVSLPTALPRCAQGSCRGVILSIDHFGNLETNISPEGAQQVGLRPGMNLSVLLGELSAPVTYGVTFASVAPGQLVLLEDSHGLLSLCVNQGSAALRFPLAVGSEVVLGLGAPGQ